MRAPSSRDLRLIAIPVIALGMSCTTPIEPCACSPVPPSGIIQGTVSAPDGAPISGARVVARAGPAGCSGEFRELGNAVSASGGEYSLRAYAHQTVLPGECLLAHAEPPAGGDLRESDPVNFALFFSNHPLSYMDTVQIDLKLRAP